MVRIFQDGPEFRAYTPEAAHRNAMDRGADCLNCPLFGCHRGPVQSEVRPGSKLLVVGEAPGKHEVAEGRPFTGRTGMELEAGLQLGGLTRLEATITNVLLCQPPEGLKFYIERLNREARQQAVKAKEKGQKPPTAKPSPIDCCRPRLDRDIEDTQAKTLLAVGGYALKATVERYGVHYGKSKDKRGVPTVAKIMNQHGSPVDLRKDHGVIIAPSLHPAFAMRGNKHYQHIVRDDIARGARIAARGNEIDWKRPPYIIFPDVEQVEAAMRWMLKYAGQRNSEVTVDIETDAANTHTCRIRCVGLRMHAPESNPLTQDKELVIVVPFRWRDGRAYWAKKQDFYRARDAVRQILDRCDLVGHNVMGFDIPVLYRHKMITDNNKLARDTMLAHHNTIENDHPHDLGFVARRKFEVPMWKHDVDHKAADNVDEDRDLHFYCGDDVITTGRIWPELREDIVRYGTQKQFHVDSRIAPVAARMGELGLVIDERRRGELSLTFNRLCRDLTAKFQGFVGYDINPSSPKQIGKWLFEEKGYRPALNPQGYEWQEGEDASTSTPAMLQLIDQGVDDDVAEAIDALIEYRACDKLRGSYLDNARVRYVDKLDTGEYAPAVVVDDRTVLRKRPAHSLLNVTWKIHVVPTGRWASSPNAQNWPARAFAPYIYDADGDWEINTKTGKPRRGSPTNLRELVVAPPGHVIIGSDYCQVEQRLYAVFSGDSFLLRAFKDADRDGVPIDPHLLNAATLFCEHDTATDTQILDTYHELKKLPKGKKKYVRTVAKRVQYLESYGGEEGKLFQTMAGERDKATGDRTFPHVRLSDAENWHKRWHRLHPETRSWQEAVGRAVREHGYVAERVHGRKRFFPGGPSKKNAPPNHTIQGTAAAIMNEAVLKVADAIPFGCWSPWTGICLQVHDYIGLYVPEDRAEEASKILYDCMYAEVEGMPILPDDVIISQTWAEQG